MPQVNQGVKTLLVRAEFYKMEKVLFCTLLALLYIAENSYGYTPR